VTSPILMVLVYVPWLDAVTSVDKVHEAAVPPEAAMISPPEMVILLDAAELTVPPVQVVAKLGPVARVTPEGKVSVNAKPETGDASAL
jgi:hypothetical protein